MNLFDVKSDEPIRYITHIDTEPPYPLTGWLCPICFENAMVDAGGYKMCKKHFQDWNGFYHGTKTIAEMIEERKKEEK